MDPPPSGDTASPKPWSRCSSNRSRIPPRLTLLKPLSAAIAIGTGGPFGAEGPIIATGGAFGSLVGQAIQVTTMERKALLAAGAAAGMAATFGAPVASVLLAIELLLFEFRARSIIPVALACSVATAVRIGFRGAAPVFAMPIVAQPGGVAIALLHRARRASRPRRCRVTRAVFAVEDAFEHLPVHWMWWPAIGAVVVGLIGIVEPRTMGVGYDNIEAILQGVFSWKALLLLGGLKFVSWAVALGSGTSGGTLAPIFTIGGAAGAICGYARGRRVSAGRHRPAARGARRHGRPLHRRVALDARVGRLRVRNHAAAGRAPAAARRLRGSLSRLDAQHALLDHDREDRQARASRRAGLRSRLLRQQLVRDWITSPAVSLRADERLPSPSGRVSQATAELTHQGFPVLDDSGDRLVGVVTRRDLLTPPPAAAIVGDLLQRPPAVAFAHWPLREAADEMVRERVGRLPVVDAANPRKVIGIITRSDLLRAHGTRLDEVTTRDEPLVRWRRRTQAG